MVQTRSNANVGTGAPQQGENSTTGGRNPPITTGEAEALIQRVGITAEQFKEVLAALAPNRERPPLPKRKKKEPLIFTDEDYPPVLSPHRDALVIKVEINNVVVHRTLVDTGSSVNVMYNNTFKELGLSRNDLKPIHTPLSGFTGDTIEAEGTITVKAGVGDGTHRL
ncbi:unnamed protein product [Cuscuta campestris]|uniref:Peptidase A2 domain-containing protein n=1 Tax=Cuscuta campestris TaxID=132261 RepID=A0A484M3T4_9ASTE|nr:unnamed protein product [Cuscuta campestris]